MSSSQPTIEANASEFPSILLPGEEPFGEAGASRRTFLQLAGFGIAASALSGCSRAPARKAVPHLQKQDDLVPGRRYWLATTCAGCAAGCGVLAKCRDGRPIKLEGNEMHALSRGGLCAVGQAQILGLYDGHRLESPRRGAQPASWEEADREIRALLEAARERGGRVRLLTGTIHSPSTLAMIETLLARVPGARHVVYDPLSVSALLDAHERTLGVRALPRISFDAARVIASFDADFLGTWISPVEFAAAYALGRRPDGEDARMSRHWQFEARVSLTGTCADERALLAPWETAPTLAGLCDLLERQSGRAARVSDCAEAAPLAATLSRLADELWAARGESLVVCGANDVEAQILAAYANELLGNYGRTLDLSRPSQQRCGDDRALAGLLAELSAGEVELLIVAGVNPAYDLPPEAGAALARAQTLIHLTALPAETSAGATWTLPLAHALESWDDAEPVAGCYGLTQPAVPPLRPARTLRLALARWLGEERNDLELLREHWRARIHPRAGTGGGTFESFMHRALHDGYVEIAPAAVAEMRFDDGAVRAPSKPESQGGLGLVLYPKVSMLDGSHAQNAWLQELPDPITKIAWDNYACVSPERARPLGLSEGQVVRIACADGDATLELPIHVQVGQHDDVVCVALGYGRQGTDRFAKVGPRWIQGLDTVEAGGTVGVRASRLLELRAGSLRAERGGARLVPTSGSVEFACSQDYHSLRVPEHLASKDHQVRDAVQTVGFAAWRADPSRAVERGSHDEKGLWVDDHPARSHRWGMVIDLARCTGCSACVVSCQAENNVPVVGRDEVRRHREMSWLRIDRYFEDEGGALRTAHQPMMCQHCGNAPCEAVCPVLATVHSDEGLNQQVYNRCVGTRYCANTCPYKVRRFNWFDYPREDELGNAALNPDVTVRSRGVMEKCSMCIQRIQDGKAEARIRGIPLKDGDVRTACEQSCPTHAIVFGDLADPASAVSKLAASRRAYGVLEELNVRPGVHYLARVVNPNNKEG
ncbi:MAG: 4Fe-4S dicluster domain-containing protein [Planctomycetota bacterium]